MYVYAHSMQHALVRCTPVLGCVIPWWTYSMHTAGNSTHVHGRTACPAALTHRAELAGEKAAAEEASKRAEAAHAVAQELQVIARKDGEGRPKMADGAGSVCRCTDVKTILVQSA